MGLYNRREKIGFSSNSDWKSRRASRGPLRSPDRREHDGSGNRETVVVYDGTQKSRPELRTAPVRGDSLVQNMVKRESRAG